MLDKIWFIYNNIHMKTIQIYTDGSCQYNPGPGGWACILMYNGQVKEKNGYIPNTTNNQMELLAIIKALEMVKECCNIELFSDSAYIVNAFQQNWIEKWEKNGWQNSQKQPIAHIELWQQLLQLTQKHNITWNKVKAHTNNVYNNRCDALAKQAIKMNI